MRRFGLAVALLLVAGLCLGQVATQNNDPRQYPEAKQGVVRRITRPAAPDTPPCTETNVPFIIAESGGIVGYEYAFPILPLFAGPPTHRNPTGIGAGPDFDLQNAYVVDGPIDNTTTIDPYTDLDQGVAQLVIWANNCFGVGLNGAAVTMLFVLETNWAPGEPRILTTIGDVSEILGPGQAANVNFADLFLWQEDTSTVVITDGATNAVVYSGAYGPSMVDNTTYTCAYIATWGTNVPLLIAATNGTGTMDITTNLQIQDPFAYCGGPS